MKMVERLGYMETAKSKLAEAGVDKLREKVRDAFVQAARKEKAPFNLKGRGCEPRVTLDRKLAAVLRGVDLPRVYISGFGANYHYPERIVKRAAATLRKKFGWDVIGFSDNRSSAWLAGPVED